MSDEPSEFLRDVSVVDRVEALLDELQWEDLIPASWTQGLAGGVTVWTSEAGYVYELTTNGRLRRQGRTRTGREWTSSKAQLAVSLYGGGNAYTFADEIAAVARGEREAEAPLISFLAARYRVGSKLAALPPRGDAPVDSRTPRASPTTSRRTAEAEQPLPALLAPPGRLAAEPEGVDGPSARTPRVWSGLTVYERKDLDLLPSRPELIRGILPEKGLVLVAGMRALGKSLLVLDMMACVSLGLPWLGRTTLRADVLSLSLEGFPGVAERVRAWEKAHVQRVTDIRWVRDGLDLKRVPDAERLGDVARWFGAGVLVVDSARAAGAGAEDTADMGKFVHGLELLQAATDGLVIVLHNTGWNSGRERGSTLLGDACDTILLLEGDPAGVRTLKHHKNRDSEMLEEPGLAFTFQLVPGTTSGVLVEATAASQVAPGSLQARVAAAVQANPGLTTSAYATSMGSPRQSVSTALNELVRLGSLYNYGTRQSPKWQIVPGDGASE